jgi:hypothetical protein
LRVIYLQTRFYFRLLWHRIGFASATNLIAVYMYAYVLT